MGRFWHIAEGRLVPGERGGADVIAIARDASGPSNLSSEQRAVLSQLEHTTIPFAERDASGVTGLVAAPAGGWRFGFVLGSNRLLLVDEGKACAAALNRAVEDEVPVDGPAGALCAVLRELLRDHPAALARVHEDF